MSNSPKARFARHVAHTQGTLTCPMLRANGDGTLSNPLRLTMLVRHADMADEIHPDRAYAQTLQIFEHLDNGLAAQTSHMATPLRMDVIEQLKQVMRDVHPIAFATGGYYSAALAVLAAERLALVGIGFSKAWVWQRGALRSVLEETTLPLQPYPQYHGILTAALGIGFAPAKIMSGTVQLSPQDLVILAMQMKLPSELAWTSTDRSEISPLPDLLLSQIARHVPSEPPLIAVFGRESL